VHSEECREQIIRGNPEGDVRCSALSSIDKRKPSPDFSDEGLVDVSLDSYFLQHLPGQHFALPLQQSVAGDVAVAVLMNATKVAIKRRYFIRSSVEFC
jgi:hypothetical protein